MNKRRILAGLLAAGLLFPATVWASEGGEPPQNSGPLLEQIQIDSDIAARGGKLSIAADAWDDDGIYSIWVQFIQQESGTLLSALMELRFGDPRMEGRYSARLEIPDNAPLGSYRLHGVALTDGKDNVSRYLREERVRDREGMVSLDELPGGDLTFTVVEDRTGPELLDCWVLEDSIKAGKEEGKDRDRTFRLNLEAADSGAGFEKATLIFESEKGKKIYASLNRMDWRKDDLYQKEISVREHQLGGEYRLVKATLEDRAGNKTILGYGKDAQPLDSGLACGVRISSREDGSGLAPVLQSVTVGEKRTSADGTDYEIIVGAADRGSKLHHITVKFKNQQTGDTVSKVIRAENQRPSREKDIYTDWLTLGDWERPGTFVLDTVVVTDEAGNSQTYRRPGDCSGKQQPLPCTASIAVAEGPAQKDTQAPVVTQLEMETETEEGMAIPLRARVSDDLSGVDTVSARFENKEGRVITLQLRPRGDGWYAGSISGRRITRWSRYELVRLTVTDKAGNRRVYQQQAGVRGEALPRQIAFSVVRGKD